MSIESLTEELVRKERECVELHAKNERWEELWKEAVRRFATLPSGIWVVEPNLDISGPVATRGDAADKVAEIAEGGKRAFILEAAEKREVAA